MRHIGRGLADNERWLSRLMLAPAILYIVLLVGFPFFLSLYYSVSDVTVASREMHFVGLENFPSRHRQSDVLDRRSRTR